MANAINIPVRLQFLRDSITEFQSILNNLQPNTSNWKMISRLLEGMTAESQKLQAQLSKPFTSEGQFKTAAKTIEKLEETSARIKVVMQGLKFSDLKLTPEQQNSFDELNKQINEVKSNYVDLVNSIKQQVLSTGNNKSLIEQAFGTGGAAKLAKADFDTMKQQVDDYIEHLRTKAAEAEKQYNEMLSNQKLAQRADFLTKNGISREALGAGIFDKYLTDDPKYGLQFKLFGKGSGKKPFLEAIEQEFKLEPGALAALAQKTLKEINEEFQKWGQKGEFNPLSGLIKSYGRTAYSSKILEGKEQFENFKSSLDEYVRLSQELSNLQNQQINPVGTQTTQRVQELEGQLRSLTDQIIHTATAGEQAKRPFTQLDSAFSQMKTTLEQTNAQFLQMQRTTQTFNSIKYAIINFMGFNQVLNLAKTAIKGAINHIKELDTVMNKISIVTDMSTSDLWNQVDAYSKMAQSYGVTIKGAYEVSQIFYQQGLETNDVMTLTNETLKLAKISGLDYAQTTDYMTTALRGFKIEMSDASKVVDVYSGLAAHTAVSQEELAIAMSKTASSMEGVGATFEESSAMIATMVAVTRESATNIGSAMKSIASRYGELTKDPTKLVDEEGEAMAFNKVDAALQSVGISMKTVDGQFREFTDVIIELSEKWDELDSVQQRYIATQFAGNRQQSRFLALVSNKDLLKANLEVAENSEDIGTLQAIKALDSVESKINQVQVAYQQFYTTIGAENVWKGLLDGTKNVINTLNGLPKLFGKIPLNAIAAITNTISLIRTVLVSILSNVARTYQDILSNTYNAANASAQNGGAMNAKTWVEAVRTEILGGKTQIQQAMEEVLGQNVVRSQSQQAHPSNSNYEFFTKQFEFSKKYQAADTNGQYNWNEHYKRLANQAVEKGFFSRKDIDAAISNPQGARAGLELLIQQHRSLQNATGESAKKFKNFWDAAGDKTSKTSQGLTAISQTLTTIGMVLNKDSREAEIFSGALTGLGGLIGGFGGAARIAAGDVLGGTMQLVTGILNTINGLDLIFENDAERLERLEKTATELNNKAKEEKANYKTLDRSLKKLDELKEKRYESAEATEEYQTAVDELASKFPEMIAGFDEAGNIILDTTNAESVLTTAREKSAQATYDAAKAELKAQKEKLQQSREKVEDTFTRLGIGGNRLVTGTSDVSDEMINKFYDFTQKYKENTTIIPEMYYIQLERTIRDIAKDSQQESLWAEYLEEVYDEQTGLFNTSLASYAEFLSKSKKEWSSTQEFPDMAQDILDLVEFVYGSESQIKQIAEIDEAIIKFNSSKGTNEIIDNYNNLMKLLNNLFSTEEGKQYGAAYNSIYKQLEDLSTAINETVTENTIYQAFSKEVISAWQQSNSANTNAWETLKNSSQAVAMVTLAIQKSVDESDYNGDWEKASKASDMVKKWQDYQEAMASYLSPLSDEELKLFNKMAEDTRHYSAEDIISKFGKPDDDLYDIIVNYYAKGIDSIRENLTKNLSNTIDQEINYNKDKDKIDDKNSLSGFYKNYAELIEKTTTSVQQQYLNSILSQYQSIRNAGYSIRSEEFGNAAISLFNQINGIADPTIKASLWDLINTNGLTTLEGIQNIIDSITNNEGITQKSKGQIKGFLETLYKNIIPNVNLAIQTATSNLLETWEDTSKELTKAMSGGVSLKEADALIQKAKALGIEDFGLSNFVNTGDKLILTAESFRDYFSKLQEATGKNIEEWQARINKANDSIEVFETQGKNGESSYTKKQLEDFKSALTSMGFNWEEGAYWNEYGKLTSAGIDAAIEAVQNNQEAFENLTLAQKIALDQLTNAYDRNQGLYKINGVTQNVEQLKIIASSTDLATDEYSKRAIKQQLNSVYGTLISDVLSKGFSNINLNDYEGLIAKEVNGKVVREDEDIIFTTYSQFIRDYVDLAGKTQDEINDLLLQAYEKDRETKSEDLIKDLIFKDQNNFFASRENLTKITKAFDIDIDELIKKGQVGFNEATQEYLISVSQLAKAGIDLTSVDNFKTVAQQSVDELFNGLSSGVKNALSGSLDEKGIKSLTDTLTYLRLDSNITFTRTKDGYRAVTEDVVNLYKELKEVDYITSQIVLDQLNESLDDATIKANGLEKEIALIRATSEDASLNFMSNKIPSAQNNPLNFFSNMQKGWQAFQEGLKSGYMDYTDFYNLFTEMGKLAEQSGELTLGGEILLKNTADAAALIEKAAGTLSVDPASNKLRVSFETLANLGVDFGSAGSEMQESVMKGVQEYAKAQVAMLDNMIKMLETVEKIEKLGEAIDVGGGFNLENFYSDDYAIQQKELIAAAEADDAFRENLEALVLNGESLWELLGKDAKKLNEQQAKAIYALIKAYQSDAFDPNGDIGSSIKEQFAAWGLELTLEDTKWTITFKDPEVKVDEKSSDVEGAAEEAADELSQDFGKVLDDRLSEIQNRPQISTDQPVEVVVQQIIVKKGDSFEVTGEDEVWDELTTQKNFDFIAYIIGMTANKQGDWVPTGTTPIWDKLDTEEQFNFFARIMGMTVNKEGDWTPTGTTSIWDELDTEEQFNFLAKILGLNVVPEEGLSSEGAETIWQLIEGYNNSEGTPTVTKAIDFIAQVLKLKPEWKDKEPPKINYSELGIQTSYTAPEATVNQKVKMVWEFEGEEEALNRKATEIYDMLSKYDYSYTLLGDGRTKFNLSNLDPNASDFPTPDEIARLREAVQLYQALGGTRYQLDGNTVIEFAGELNTEKVNDTVDELEKEDVEIPVETSTVDDTTVQSYQPEAKTLNVYTKVHSARAEGNVGQADAAGTLMGELGPELYVTGGRYFIAGQNGAEFVKLADDAIVFNHLQTRKLLQNGATGRGRPITNERNATSMATGNITGPAKASASEALNTLRQLRAEWDAIANLPIQALAGKGGGGGGGGNDVMKPFIDQVERWYNLLQKIAKLEKDITHEETLRTKLQSDLQANGAAYYQSQRRSLQQLLDQLSATQELLQSQKDYRQIRIKELNENGVLNRFYKFDENTNQLYFNNDDLGYKALANLVATGVNNAPVHTLEEQVKLLESWGLGPYMKYNENGEEIKKESGKESEYYTKVVEAAWKWIESGKEEIEGLNDSINEKADNYLSLMDNFNQILNDIKDNQIEVEDKVLNAIIENRQQEIDDAQKNRDAMEQSATKFIDGLTEQLDKERKMYERQESNDELTRLRRQRDILVRSGGSASSIRNLEEQIRQKERETYFTEQQDQIDAVKEASDKEIERLDAQIEIMTETLEYQKENGLLWAEVSQIMRNTPEEISDYITKYDKDYQAGSLANQEKIYQELLKITQQWTEYRDDSSSLNDYTASPSSLISNQNTYGSEWNIFDQAMKSYIGEEWNKYRNHFKGIYDAEMAQSGDATRAAAMVRENESYQSVLARKIKENEAVINAQLNDNTSSNNSDAAISGKGTIRLVGVYNNKVFYDNTIWKSVGTTVLAKEYEKYIPSDYVVISSSPNSITIRSEGQSSRITYICNKKNMVDSSEFLVGGTKGAKEGGLVEETGPVLVHGSKLRPESFLNATETKTWREDILNGKKGSLTSNLINFNNKVQDLLDGNNINNITDNNQSIVIEHVEANMNATIANGYDARQAGQNMLEEIVKIARKTSVQQVGR